MRTAAIVEDGREGDWLRAHTALTRLARERAAADAAEGQWLLLAWRSGAHGRLGFGTFSEYIERLLGYTTREKLRVAEALEILPGIGTALAEGQLTWCGVRELTRVATADTERDWLDAARGCPRGRRAAPDDGAPCAGRACQLGFREREARAVLTDLGADTALRDASVEQLLREALCRIRRVP